MSKKGTKKPSKDELLNVLSKEKSIIKVAKKYNVDEKSIRRWRDSYGISRSLKDMKNAPLKDKLKVDDVSLENLVLSRLRSDTLNIKEFSKELNVDSLQVLKIINELENSGELIEKSYSGYYINRNSVPQDLIYQFYSKKRKFAIIGDTHLNSKEQQLTSLKMFYNLCKKEGITEIYHAGDLVAGNKIYPGQEYETFFQGVDDQVQYVIDNYPHVDGITTYFITGNHDYSYFKRDGIDIGKMIERSRPDMKYLGQLAATIKFTENVKMKLLHPDGGCSYAKSYRPQKIVEGLSPENKPNILVLGHFHTAGYFRFRGVDAFLTGAFEGQTPYLQRKGLEPEVGGWILDLSIKDDKVSSIKPQFVSFDHMYKDY